MSDSHFPADWPKPCPPDDAIPANGIIYRRTKKNPPSEKDLQTHHQRGTGKDFTPCGRCGLSVLLDEHDLEHHYRLFDYHGKYVFKANLVPDYGKMKIVGGCVPSHTNIWFHETTVVPSLFSFDREMGK